jgi:hypothetical protein
VTTPTAELLDLLRFDGRCVADAQLAVTGATIAEAAERELITIMFADGTQVGGHWAVYHTTGIQRAELIIRITAAGRDLRGAA